MTNKKAWTKEEEQELKELRNNNVPYADISKRLGRSSASIKSKLHKLKVEEIRQETTASLKDAIHLKLRGYSWEEIADQSKFQPRSPNTIMMQVARYAHQHYGISLEEFMSTKAREVVNAPSSNITKLASPVIGKDMLDPTTLLNIESKACDDYVDKCQNETLVEILGESYVDLEVIKEIVSRINTELADNRRILQYACELNTRIHKELKNNIANPTEALAELLWEWEYFENEGIAKLYKDVEAGSVYLLDKEGFIEIE